MQAVILNTVGKCRRLRTAYSLPDRERRTSPPLLDWNEWPVIGKGAVLGRTEVTEPRFPWAEKLAKDSEYSRGGLAVWVSSIHASKGSLMAEGYTLGPCSKEYHILVKI